MNKAQKFLLDNKLNDRHINDAASVYTSDAMIMYAREQAAEIERLEKRIDDLNEELTV